MTDFTAYQVLTAASLNAAVNSKLATAGGELTGGLRWTAPRAWSGSNIATNALIHQSVLWTGSNSGALQSPGNWFLHYDRMDAGIGVGNGFSALHPYVYVGGPGKIGQTNAIDVSLVFDARSGNTGAADARGVYGGIRAAVQASDNDWGTTTSPETYRSGLYSMNLTAELLPGATGWAGLTGIEVDVGAYAGTTVLDKVGISVTLLGLDRVHGARDEYAFGANNQYAQGVGAGWNTMIKVGSLGGFFPMAVTGTIIGAAAADGIMNTANGIVWDNVAFSGFSLKMPNFNVAGTGFLTARADVNGVSATFGRGISLGLLSAAGTDVAISTVNGANIVLNPQGAGIVQSQAPLTVVGDVTTTSNFRSGANQVIGPRISGYALPTASLARGTFDPATVTLAVLAQHVAALQTDLMTHGAIGA